MAEESEAEYRAKREEAKVWRRERDEEDRRVQEIRARQARVYCDDMASRVNRVLVNGEEERLAEQRRVEKEKKKQLEEEKRNESTQQSEGKRRKEETSSKG